MAYEFHYTPTGTGVISGKEVLEQTEDAINDLGNTAISGVQEALDKAEQALTNSENAVDDAQTALNTANNAEGVAIQAQNDVSNLSGTLTNIGNRVTTAEGNITNLQGRMTTAEGNITNLQGRMTTAEGNIGNLQTAVSTAQATANSAQQTATTARQQSYVFRYSSTALVDSSTNSNTLLDNTDNLKVGDKVIDSSGVLFSITAIDTQNSTFTIGTALIDLANDSDVVHKSGDETISGTKTFLDVPIPLKSSTAELGVTGGYNDITFLDKNNKKLSGLTLGNYASSKLSYVRLSIFDKDVNDNEIQNTLEYSYVSNNSNAYLRVNRDNLCALGSSSYRWKGVYATNYYYGSNNVEFSTKFVTTDTNQSIGGTKDFSDVLRIYNSNASSNTAQLWLKNLKVNRGQSVYGDQAVWFRDATDKPVTSLVSRVTSTGASALLFYVYNVDQNNQQVANYLSFVKNLDGSCYLLPDQNNVVELGSTSIRLKDFYTNKINGVEPSSLSLPSDRSARIDISSYITNLGNGDNNQYIVPANGYIWLHFTSINSALCYSQTSGGLTNYSQTFVRYQGDGQLYAFFPVRKNDTFVVQIYTSSTAVVQNAYFIPCQGNV